MTGAGARVVIVVADEVREPGVARDRALDAAGSGADVTVLALAAGDRREDVDIGGAHLVRLPMAAAYAKAVAAKRARRRRMRRVFGYASPDELRLARTRSDLATVDAEHAAATGHRLAAARLRLAGRARRFVTRARPALQRRADRVQRLLWRGWDGIVRRAPRPGWQRVLPQVQDLELTFGAELDDANPDVIEAHGLDVLPVAARAAARARSAGRPCRLVYVRRAGVATAGPGGATRAWRSVESEFVDLADEVVDAATPSGRPVEERPFRVDRGGRALLAIGPANMAGQGWAWGRAVARNFPDVDVEVFMVERGNMNFPADVRIDPADFAHSTKWQLRWAQHLRTEATHVLMEAGRPVMGRLNGGFFAADVPHLREAGINVALVFHGSEIRDPAKHAQMYPWSPFRDPTEELTARLQRQLVDLVPLVEAFDGPKFFSTPDLLDDVPGGIWLPVVVDLDVWTPADEPLQRERPLVVHAPSRRALKGTELIEPVLETLVERGLIDYRRIEGVPSREVPDIMRSADIVLDHFGIGNYGVVTCEAMASGRVSISHIHERVRARVPDPIPTLEATPDTLASVIEGVLDDRDAARAVAAQGPAFVRKWHDGRRSAAALADFLGRPASG